MTATFSTSSVRAKAHAYATQLSSSQRAGLKSLAHGLKPIVQVGGQGLTPGIASEIAHGLQTHELIKIQLQGNTDAAAKKESQDALTDMLPEHAFVVARIGRTVILYLEKDPTLARITLKSLKERTVS